MTKDDAAGLQAGQCLANVAAVVLPVRQQHHHPVAGARAAVTVHKAVGETERVRHRRAATGLQAGDEVGQPVNVRGEVLMARHRVGAVAAEGEHRHLHGAAARRPAERGDRSLLCRVHLGLGAAAAHGVAHASGSVDQEQQAAARAATSLGQRERTGEYQCNSDRKPGNRAGGMAPRLRQDHQRSLALVKIG